MNKITGEMLTELGNYGHAFDVDRMSSALNHSMEAAEINTPLRQAHALAQWLLQTDGFVNMTAECDTEPFEHEMAIGNFKNGDGVRYRPRGLSGLIGRRQYTMYSQAAGIDAVSYPDVISTLPDAVNSAAWRWTLLACNHDADLDDAEALTMKLRGKLDDMSDLIERLEACKRVLAVE